MTYYSGDPGTEHRAVYSAVWTGGTGVRDRTVHGAEDNRLSDEEARLASASDAVPEEGPMRCSDRRFNRVILPRSAPGVPDLVYLLTPQTDFVSVPLGGHHRFEVTDGKILAQRSFSKSCISVPLDKKAEALGISHMLDPTPTEIHVVSVYAASKPIYVMTTMNDRVWVAEVSAGRGRVRTVK
ncbi:hypothetical protein L7H23_03910 [Sphingopyxis sp. BSN-002]|uniref:hypothetical protein n=1 Tax=Sphingopyxis sp. BSN-002 TaxID=2911495 RepID=UPI001EDC7A91|nr:hypothetical protein [Sphingopyxis sp. BSN-002]UKK85269.1 hypothetical protein L7H23_03910 [Sphingopyxis sp. BSN-002]